MIRLIADRPDDLLAVRFATSPVWETVLAVRSYEHERDSPLQRPWRRAVAGAASRLDLAPLAALHPRTGYVPDFLTPPPRVAAPRLRSQLAEVRRTPLGQVERELLRCRATLTDPARVPIVERLLADPAAARTLLAELIAQAWDALVAPYWPRIRALLSADVAYRSRLLAEHGLRRVVGELDRRIAWNGAVVEVEAPEERAVALDERGVVLMPSAFVWPGTVAIADEPWQPTIVYPARGIAELWRSPRKRAGTLARLLGRTRATILASLDAPCSTTDLAARLGLSPSGASRHLTALRDAGLLTTTRHGHELRYGRTRLGSAVVRASVQERSGDGPGSAPTPPPLTRARGAAP